MAQCTYHSFLDPGDYKLYMLAPEFVFDFPRERDIPECAHNLFRAVCGGIRFWNLPAHALRNSFISLFAETRSEKLFSLEVLNM